MLEIKNIGLNPKLLTALKNEQVRSVNRMSKCLDAPITCMMKFNGKRVHVPSPCTWIGMAKNIDLQDKVKDIMLHLIESETKPAINLIDFAVSRVPIKGLWSIDFYKWQISQDTRSEETKTELKLSVLQSELEQQTELDIILTQLAQKTHKLGILAIRNMCAITAEMRGALANLVVKAL